MQDVPGDNAAKLVQDILSKEKVKVVFFGERHFSPNPFYDFGLEVLPALYQAGFTALAIENCHELQPSLDQFLQGDLPFDEYKECTRSEWYCAKDPAIKLMDVRFHDMLLDFSKIGGIVQGVDGVNKEPERDRLMAERIDELLKSHKRVVAWLGKGHAHVRPNGVNREHLTAAEHAADRLDKVAVYSIIQVENDTELQRVTFTDMNTDTLILRSEQERIHRSDLDFGVWVWQYKELEASAYNVEFGWVDATYWSPKPIVHRRPAEVDFDHDC